MINVNQITSQLAKMPDQALQKYAALNKNDPYILALAVAESNRRKEMRQAAQGAQGMMPQPKVADQAVQNMAAAAPMGPAGPAQPMPEDMGIGRLPAGDMNFADGGIVAFADGGEVERYNGLEGSFTGRPAPTSMSGAPYSIPGMQIGMQPFMPQAGAPEQTPWLRRKFAEMQASMETGAAERQLSLAQSRIAAGRGSATDFAIVDAAKQKAGPTAQDMAQFDAATNLYMTERAAKQAASAADTVKAAPKLDTTKRPPSAPRVEPIPDTRATAPAAPELDPNALFETAMTRLGKEKRPEEGLLEAVNKERIDAAKAEKAGVEALNAKFADAFKGRRERLDTREAALGKMKDQNFGLALLQAGAAMMSTPGSLGTAIGRGIQSGSQQYVAGIDKLNAAKDKLADARDRLDDLQINRDEMSAREILKAENKIRDTAISGKESMIKFVMERDKVNRETAAKIVDSQMQLGLTQLREAGAMERTLIQERGQTARANAQIAAVQSGPERLAFNSYLAQTVTKDKPQGDPAKAYEMLVAGKREGVTEEKLRADWLDPTKRMVIAQDYPNVKTFEDYKLLMSGAGGMPLSTGKGAGGFSLVGTRPGP